MINDTHPVTKDPRYIRSMNPRHHAEATDVHFVCGGAKLALTKLDIYLFGKLDEVLE